jgi:Domain of unknown function (DUF4424)
MTMPLALICISALIAAITHFSRPGFTNDTEAAIGVGGLVFTKSEDIEMLSEELFVSSERIVVKYHFRNNAREDITTLIAFPLPAVKFDPESNFDGDFGNFSTTVDGTPVELREEQKTSLQGDDETKTLERYAIALNPYVAHEAMSKATAEIKQELQRLGLLDDAGNPTWSFQKSFYWEQRFPAGQEIKIEHQYTPLLGGAVSTGLGLVDDPRVRAFYDKYCVDEQFVGAAKEKAKGNSLKDHAKSFSEKWIEYLLTTGANWSGPIRKFRLVVDKGRADNLVSFCGNVYAKSDPPSWSSLRPTLFPTTT